ncbi:hypothetical protein ACRXCV_05035 [Halobacteriovorax sp. GFR7]|uniref:hypothetical protein n=1 Tax=unclassified Halobacteriovorax TaxID=2639665 RepID=UPI003D97E882
MYTNQEFTNFFEGFSPLSNPDQLLRRWKALDKTIETLSDKGSLYLLREVLMLNLERWPNEQKLKNLVTKVNRKIARNKKG